MKSRKNIVFLGMMGSGKTSIGKLVSEKLKLDFFDIDECIEKDLNLTISDIFKKRGENFFREVEKKTTLNILDKKNIVVSLGGGAFLNKEIRDEILLNHLSFWLKSDIQIILERIKNSIKRPLAFNSSTYEIKNIIKKRSKIYSKAMYHVDCDNLSKKSVVRKILNIYEAN